MAHRSKVPSQRFVDELRRVLAERLVIEGQRINPSLGQQRALKLHPNILLHITDQVERIKVPFRVFVDGWGGRVGRIWAKWKTINGTE